MGVKGEPVCLERVRDLFEDGQIKDEAGRGDFFVGLLFPR